MEPVEAKRVAEENSYHSNSNSHSNSYDKKLYALLAWAVFPLTSAYFVLDKKYKDDEFLMFHAYESLAAGVILWVGSFLMSATVILLLLVPLVQLVGLVVWILGMVKAYQGEKFKLPIIGDWAEKQVAKSKKS